MMSLSYPFAATVLADRLRIASVAWDVQRSDELSGTGDGRVWQAELADPLWRAEVTLANAYYNDAKQIAALIRKLHGSQESFYLYDPLSPYPQADPDGSIIGSSNVQVNSVPTGNRTLTLKGLPASYTLTIGDKFAVTFGTSPTRTFFGEVSETVVAGGDGVTAAFEVFPHVPAGVATNDAVSLKKPACLGFIMPGSFNVGSTTTMTTDGMGFTFMERRR